MLVASWNINSVRARTERLLGWLEARRPDVVCLQELKCTDEQFPSEPVRALGYHPVLFGQKTYNGVAILSPRGARARRARVPRRRGRRPGPGGERDRRRRPRHLGVRAQRAGRGLARLPPEARLVRPVPPLAGRSATGRTTCSSSAATSTWLPRSATSGTRSSGRGRRSSRCPSGRRSATRWSSGSRTPSGGSTPSRAGTAGGTTGCSASRRTGGSGWTTSTPRRRSWRELHAAGVDREARKGTQPSDHAPVWARFGLPGEPEAHEDRFE